MKTEVDTGILTIVAIQHVLPKLIVDSNQVLHTPYNYRGIAYSNKGEIDRAIEDFNTAIRRKDNYAEAYSNRGSSLPHQRGL